MQLLGLDPLTLLLALAAFGGTIVLLHLRRRPPPRVIVPSLWLLRDVLPAERPAPARTRALRDRGALVLALLLVTALLLALADPQRGPQAPGRRLVLLIDRSASMAARDVAPSRLEAAKARARARVAQLGPGETALIATLDRRATPRTPFTADRDVLDRALSTITQSDAAGDLGDAARLAHDLGSTAATELVLFSDGNLAEAEPAARRLANMPSLVARHERVGTSGRNVAVTHFSARRYPLDRARFECWLHVTNFGDTPEPLTVRIDADGVRLHEDTLTLAPHASAWRVRADLTSGARALTASIALARGADPLVEDDRAIAALPPRRHVRVLSVSRDNRYLEAALLLDAQLEVVERAPEAYEDARGFDVVVFDRTLPARRPEVPALYLGPAQHGGVFPLARTGEVQRPFVAQVASEHPLVRGLALRDVNIARAVRVALAPDDVAVVSATDRTPLLVDGLRDGAPFVALTFDVLASDLPLRTAFPLLVLRALDRLTAAPATEPATHVAGEPCALPLRASGSPKTLRAPDGTHPPVATSDGQVRAFCARAGAYTIRSAGREETLAVQRPAQDEGAIAPRTLALGDARAATRASAPAHRVWPSLLALALLLLALEWAVSHRRGAA